MDRLSRATALAVVAYLMLSGRPVAADEPSPAPPSAGVATIVAEAGAEVVFRALSLLGVRYQFGGNSPDTGLDCSGLVRLVFHETLGLPLPRRSEEISRVGGSIATTELQPGDLVFFNTLRRAFSHVGIYIGNNQFVHAPSSGGSIRVENLGSDYWVRRFDGARRVLVAGSATGPTSAGVPVPSASAAVTPTAVPSSVRSAVVEPSLQPAPRATTRMARAAPRPAPVARNTGRARPIAVAVRADGDAAAARGGPRQRIPNLYVN